MWNVLIDLLNRDKGVLLVILLVYAACVFALPVFILISSSIYLGVCLITLTRKIVPVLKISFGIPLLLSWILLSIFSLTISSYLNYSAQLVGFLVTLILVVAIFVLLQFFFSFITLVSSFQNVGFFRSCWYAVRHHWDKLLLFLMLLYPFYLLIYDVFVAENIAGIMENWSIVKVFLLVVWGAVAVPYITAAWLIAKPYVAPCPAGVALRPQNISRSEESSAVTPALQQSKEVSAPFTEKVVAESASASLSVSGPQQPLSLKNMWTVFIALLKADRKLLLAAFISFAVLAGIIPQMIFFFLIFFYGLFLVIVSKRYAMPIVSVILLWMWPVLAINLHFNEKSLIEPIIFLFLTLPVFLVVSFFLFLSALSCLISAYQQVGFFKAYGRACRYHLGKSVFCIFIVWIVSIKGINYLISSSIIRSLPLGVLVFIACLFVLYFYIFIPYMLAAWLRLRPNLPPPSPAPASAPYPCPVSGPEPVPGIRPIPVPATQDEEAVREKEKRAQLVQDKKNLFQFLLARNTEGLKQLLKKSPKLAQETWPDNGNTPLHVAALNGWREEMCILLEVDPSACHMTNKAGKRPVDLAKEQGYDNLAVYLEPRQE